MTVSEMKGQEAISVRVWEFNLLTLEGVLAGAALMVAVVAGGPRVLGELLVLPTAVWMGAGVFTLLWALYPSVNAQCRVRRGRGLGGWLYLASSTVGAVAGAALFALLS